MSQKHPAALEAARLLAAMMAPVLTRAERRFFLRQAYRVCRRLFKTAKREAGWDFFRPGMN